ncbi:hypothetical protein HNP40_000714 [Mycobacteroides chelonae]|nr:hypothetical protein [Mycobacteroides chelonae]
MAVHIVASQVMPASCERTFDLIYDYGRRLEWDALPRRAYVEGGSDTGVGTVAVCTARRILGGYAFRTRYVTFKPPHLAAIELKSNHRSSPRGLPRCATNRSTAMTPTLRPTTARISRWPRTP